MDTRALLDQLIKSGKELADKGRTAAEQFAEQNLDLPDEGPEREAALANAGKGAAAAMALAILLGTKGGRALTGSLLKVGSLAALGGLAYKTYRDWQADTHLEDLQPAGMPVGELTGLGATARSEHLLKAMIAAANADGHITAEERKRIAEQFRAVDINGGTQTFINAQLANPASVQDVAAPVDSATFAAEIYLLSASLLPNAQGAGSSADRDYLNALAAALELDSELSARLEAQIWTD